MHPLYFIARHQQLSQENASREILAAFKQSDQQKRGFITAQELRQILTTTGEKVYVSSIIDDAQLRLYIFWLAIDRKIVFIHF